ncbi:MAG: D-2-hydroxyacid dehydrogenase [Gammaproteobacteria bacterium]|nr:D-2-hydroxyacid dehydrogenase [Gammaproteobacteria bacterium]
MFRRRNDLRRLALLIACTCSVAATAGDAGDGARLIAEFGLRESAEPVAAHPRWRRPRRILVDSSYPGLIDALRAATPGIEWLPFDSLATLRQHVRQADAVFGRQALICDPEVLAAGRRLVWLATGSAGVEFCVAQPLLRKRQIVLTNMRAVAGPVIAEHAMAMLLALSRSLHVWIARQTHGDWNDDRGGAPLTTIAGKTLLVVGLGGIGIEVARRAHALGARVIATRATAQPQPAEVEYVGGPDELDRLLGEADLVVNALPLTPATRGLFDAARFARMKRGAIFVNVGRGGTVVTLDLVAALQRGQLGGAGLDVTDPEPLPRDHPLWRAPNVIVTPHVAGDSDRGTAAQLQVLRENLRRYLAGGRLLSVVDLQRGY